MLARNYRFTALNSIGQTIAIAGVTIMARRWKLDSSGAVAYESSEGSVMSNAGTIANAAYSSSSGVDNSSSLYIGGDFEVTLTSPASSSGVATIYYETSTDGGTTWPANGSGAVVCVVPAVSSASTVKHFRLS